MRQIVVHIFCVFGFHSLGWCREENIRLSGSNLHSNSKLVRFVLITVATKFSCEKKTCRLNNEYI
jgi:hypothetical protein